MSSSRLSEGYVSARIAKMPLPPPGPCSEQFSMDFHDGQEEIMSCPNTPSMTRGSSRSTSSSVATCEGCASTSSQCICLGHSDADSIRIQVLDGYLTRSPLIGAATLAKYSSGRSEVGSGRKRQGPLSQTPGMGPRSTTSGESSLVPSQLRIGSRLINNTPLSPSETEACMDVDNENSSSENSDDDVDDSDEDLQDEDDDYSGPGSNLEAMVLEILGSEDLTLAVNLIPFLHRAYYRQTMANVGSKVGPWCEGLTKLSPNAADAIGCSQVSSSATQSNEAAGGSRKRQRGYSSLGQRKKSDEEEDGDNDEDDKQNAKDRGDPSEHGSSQELPRLACPFHKKDPAKYCVRHSQSEGSNDSDYYRTCAGPGSKNIQRLKEHIKRKHYPVQCDRCYENFPCSDRAAGIRLLESHRQSASPCERRDPSLKEGISDAQCADLDKKRSVKKGSASSRDMKSRIEKYMEIWDVLFPGVPRPNTPWYDGSFSRSHSAPSSHESTQFTEIFKRLLELQVNQQHICFPPGRETEMRHKIVGLALKAFNLIVRLQGAPSTTNSSSTPSIQQASLLGGSYVQPSTPRTTERWTSSTPSRSSDMRSGIFHMDLQSSPTNLNPVLGNTRRQGHLRGPYPSTQQLSQQTYVTDPMSVVQNPPAAGPGFSAERDSMGTYTDNSFSNDNTGHIGEDWMQQYLLSIPSNSAFDDVPATAGYETGDADRISRAMMAPPTDQNMNDWSHNGGAGRMSFERS